jgi:tripartite-type tricarboxylate transporter receptor subunit TctC
MPSAAPAQTGWPARPLRFVVPWPPGGPTDITARALADPLARRLSQPVVVENRPGASGNIGMEQVARSPADGHTMALATFNNMVTNKYVDANTPYDAATAFTVVTILANFHNILFVHAGLGVRTLPELIELARRNPGRLTYATTAIGSQSHLGIELLMHRTGVRIEQVQYRGAAQALTDVGRGDVTMFLAQEAGTQAFVEAGQVRPLAVASPARSPSSPDVPTFAEQGLAGFDAMSFFSLVVPAGTPSSIVTRLNREVVEILATPELRSRLEALGAEAVGSTPEASQARVLAEITRWGEVIGAAGIRPQ